MEKIQQLLKGIGVAIYGIWFFYLMYILLFLDRKNVDLYYYRFVTNNICLLVIGCGIIALLAFVNSKIKKSNSCLVKRSAAGFSVKIAVASLILLVVQLFVAYHIFFYVDWDVTTVRKGASMFIEQGYMDYYTVNYLQVNPNNLGMLFLTTIPLWLGRIFSFNGYGLLVVIGVILVNLSVLLCGKTLYLVTKEEKVAWLGFGVAGLLFGLSPWIMVPYTDIFSILLPISTLYLYFLGKEKNWCPLLQWLGVIGIPILGYLIKPTNILVLIAIGLIELLYYKKQDWNWKKLMVIVVIAILFVVAKKGISIGLHQMYQVTPDESKEKTMTHYAMMGWCSYEYGEYNPWDDEYTNSFPTKKEKQQGNLLRLKERLIEYGPKGTFDILTNKSLKNFNNGSFGWGKEWNFANQMVPRDSKISSFMRNLFYINKDNVDGQGIHEGGNYYQVILLLEQFLWIHILLGCMLCIFGKEKSKEQLLFMITALGIMIFVSMFECNARYLISYLPIFVITGVLGFLPIFRKAKLI